MTKNERYEKGELFRKGYRRAQRAIKAGFYLEAVSLCESLIVDRLTQIFNNNVDQSFNAFSVGKAASNLKSHKVTAFDPNLWEDCASWSKHRNELSHKMAALTLVDVSTWRSRLALAKATAELGLALANRCSTEAKKHRL